MNIASYIGNPRITDYSFVVADYIYTTKNSIRTIDLENLYNYHRRLCIPPNALYPQSNWQPHRLCLMSAIAVRLNRTAWISECHNLAVAWVNASSCKCCDGASQDFHWRDSCAYKVYGWWALCAAFVYLQPKTRRSYKPYFAAYLTWIRTFDQGRIHIEYRNSKVADDIKKPNYNRPFDPTYNNNLMRWYNRLLS